MTRVIGLFLASARAMNASRSALRPGVSSFPARMMNSGVSGQKSFVIGLFRTEHVACAATTSATGPWPDVAHRPTLRFSAPRCFINANASGSASRFECVTAVMPEAAISWAIEIVHSISMNVQPMCFSKLALG